jgi:ABC-type dipeptide/oligopeptide/nickel transport system permease component
VGLGRYTIRRLVFLVPQLAVVLVLIFVIVAITPGNPARVQLGAQATPDAVKRLERQMGLQKPIYDRFAIYVEHLFHGDFGRSWVSGSPVSHDLLRRAPATFELITLGLVFALLLAIPLGVATAVRETGLGGRVADRLSFVYALLAGAIPDFWFALILIFMFFHKFGIAATPIGQLDLDVIPPPRHTGALLIDSAIAGHWTALWNHIEHLVLPVATLVFVNAAPILRMTRNNVNEHLQSDYIKFARANGLPYKYVIRYALRNALVPIITLSGLIFTLLIGGAVLTETIFSWGGMGQYAVQSLLNADWAALQGVLLVASAVALLVYLAIDLLHAVVDPRIRSKT